MAQATLDVDIRMRWRPLLVMLLLIGAHRLAARLCFVITPAR